VTADGRSAARQLLRAAAARRWLLAAGLVAAAVATALPVLAPAPAPGTAVLTAAHDLAAGAAVRAEDLAVVRMPAGLVPEGALADGSAAVGRLVAGAVRAREPLTDVRLVGPGLLAALGLDGLVAVPVRLADPAAAALLRPGDRVDVLAASTGADGPPAAAVVAAAAPVLTVPEQAEGAEGALVVLAAAPAAAARLASAEVSSRLSVVVRP